MRVCVDQYPRRDTKKHEEKAILCVSSCLFVDQAVLFKREEVAMFTATVMDCPFCPLALRPVEIMLENEDCLFIQQAEVVLIGSGLIIPKAHRESVFALTPDEWTATFTLLQQVKALLDAQYQPDGYNVGWNCGEVGGQTVFHAHLHVIPRYVDEPLAGKGIRYWIKQEANKRTSRVDG